MESVNSLRISAPQWWPLREGRDGKCEGRNEKCEFLARESVSSSPIVWIFGKGKCKFIANFSATMVTSLPSLSLSLSVSLSLSLSLSHRKYLTHNIGSASALPIIILKTIGNRKGDCAWSCSRWQTQPEKICKSQRTNQCHSLRTLYWFVLCNLLIFSGCVCHLEQLHAQSPFLFPIVFSINLIPFFDLCSVDYLLFFHCCSFTPVVRVCAYVLQTVQVSVEPRLSTALKDRSVVP